MEDADLEALKNQFLFKDFSDEEFSLVEPFLLKKEFPPLEPIVEEGVADSAELFLIVKGSVKILKWDDKKHFTIPIGHIDAGSSFGEMAFVNHSPRTSTIETTKETTVYSLSSEPFEKGTRELKEIYQKLIKNILILTNSRITSTNEKYIQSIRQATEKMQITSESASNLFKFLASAFSLNIFLYFLLAQNTHVDFYLFNFIFWLGLGGVFFYFKKTLYLYNDQLGLKTNGMVESLKKGFLILLIVVPILFLSSFLKLETVAESHNLLWFLGLGIYVFLYEIIGRGYIQKLFLTFYNENQVYLALIFSALFLTLLPVYTFSVIPPFFIFFNLVLNILLGWIYLKDQNLAGVILIHYFSCFFARIFGLI